MISSVYYHSSLLNLIMCSYSLCLHCEYGVKYVQFEYKREFSCDNLVFSRVANVWLLSHTPDHSTATTTSCNTAISNTKGSKPFGNRWCQYCLHYPAVGSIQGLKYSRLVTMPMIKSWTTFKKLSRAVEKLSSVGVVHIFFHEEIWYFLSDRWWLEGIFRSVYQVLVQEGKSVWTTFVFG